ncbi:MAG: hypothetical protein WBN57_11050 [Gammaproteobacteria bacterium]
MVLRYIFTLLLLSSLAGCSAGLQVETGQSLFRLLPGSDFILRADVVIPPGQIRASFQGGQRVNGAGEYEPRCELEVRDFAEEPQTIPAGSYRIVAVHGLDRYVTRPGENIQLAAAEVLQLASDGGDSQWYMRTYHMRLQSDVHPDAPALVCGGAYNYAFYVRYPTLQEMQLALGDYAGIRLR